MNEKPNFNRKPLALLVDLMDPGVSRCGVAYAAFLGVVKDRFPDLVPLAGFLLTKSQDNTYDFTYQTIQTHMAENGGGFNEILPPVHVSFGQIAEHCDRLTSSLIDAIQDSAHDPDGVTKFIDQGKDVAKNFSLTAWGMFIENRDYEAFVYLAGASAHLVLTNYIAVAYQTGEAGINLEVQQALRAKWLDVFFTVLTLQRKTVVGVLLEQSGYGAPGEPVTTESAIQTETVVTALEVNTAATPVGEEIRQHG